VLQGAVGDGETPEPAERPWCSHRRLRLGGTLAGPTASSQGLQCRLRSFS
jgi:hypothetical protein